MKKDKPWIHIVLRAIVVFIAFIFLLGGINILNKSINLDALNSMTNYINSNAWVLILMFAMFVASEVVYKLKFPKNLPAPILQGIPAIYIITFVFELLVTISPRAINPAWINFYISPFVFLGILIIGYYEIIIHK